MSRLLSFLPWIVLLGPTGQAADLPDTTDALRLTTTVALPNVAGRIDHMAFDAERNRLYVAALGNNSVEVIDVKHAKPIATIKELRKPQGIAVVTTTGEIVVASGDDGKCRKYDVNQRLVATINHLDDADNVRFDATDGLAYVGYGDGALAIVAIKPFRKVADVKLAGHPESFQLETKGKRIFVNVPDAGQIALIDREKRAVMTTWPVSAARANFPMALDEADHRLFVGCRNPARLLVIDTESGKLISSMPCTSDTDDIFYDGAPRRVYVVGGEGLVGVFQQRDADHYSRLATVLTSPGARTSLFVPTQNRLYVAAPRRGKQQAEIRQYATIAPLAIIPAPGRKPPGQL